MALTSKASVITSRGSGETARTSSCPRGLPLFHLGPAARPVLIALFASETLLGRQAPWIASTLTALIIAGVLWYAIWQAGLGRRQVAPAGRQGMLAWAFFGWMLAATALGVNSVYGDEPLRRILALAVAFWVAHDNITGPRDRRNLLVLLMGLAAIVCLTGLIQWPVPPEADGRLRSALDSPTLLGALLCLTLPLWPASARLHHGAVALVLRGVGGIACVLALVLAGSRLSILAVAVGLAVLGVGRLGGRNRRAWIVALLSLSLGVAVLAGVWAQPGHESSASHRAFIWHTCLRLLSDPRVALLGTGVGGFRDGFSMSRPWVGTDRSDTLAIVRDAHNDILQVACESGAPGGLLFVGLMACAIWGRSRDRTGACRTLHGIRVALAAWCLNGMANGSVDVPSVAVPAFVLLGAAMGAGGGVPRGTPVPRSGLRQAIAAIAACLLVAPWVGQQAAARASDLLWLRSDDLVGEGRLQALAASVKLAPRPESAIALALASDGDEAVALLSDAARTWPWNAEIRYQMCRQLALEDPPAALGWAREAVALDPYNPYYLRQVAVLECALGQTLEGVENLKRAASLFERTLEVAIARHGHGSPEAEALRIEIRETQARLSHWAAR